MALSRVHSSSKCSRHALIQLKVLHRLHYSKAKLVRIFPNLSPVRDRCKQTIHHMLWSCPKLAPFWSSFFDTISKTYGCNIMPSPTSAIFGILSVPDDSNIPAHSQKVIAFSSPLARRSILFKWKYATALSHNQWIKDVMQNVKLEKKSDAPSTAPLRDFTRPGTQ